MHHFRLDIVFWAEVKVLTKSICARWCETKRVAAFLTNSMAADLAFVAHKVEPFLLFRYHH